MTATKTAVKLVSTKAGQITLGVAGEPLTLESARRLVGRVMVLPTMMADETAPTTIESVSRNRETGDIVAYLTRAGKSGGVHARLVQI